MVYAYDPSTWEVAVSGFLPIQGQLAPNRTWRLVSPEQNKTTTKNASWWKKWLVSIKTPVCLKKWQDFSTMKKRQLCRRPWETHILNHQALSVVSQWLMSQTGALFPALLSLSLVSTVNEHHTISKPKDPLICTLVSEEPGGKWVFLALCVVQIALEHRSKAVAKRTSHWR